MSLTSHGAAVHFALIDADTLVAYTGSTAPTTIDATTVVFSVELSAANGSYDFALDKPLDQPLAGPDGLNFSFNYTAEDFDGSTAASSFKVTVVDDVPTADAGPAAQVDESGLTAATDPYGTGNDPGAQTQASGTFGLHFGADGPAVVTTHVDTVGIDNQAENNTFNPPFVGNFVLGNIGAFGFDQPVARGDIAGIEGDTVTITDTAGPFTLNNIELGTVEPGTNTPTTGTVTLIGLDGQGDVLARALTLPGQPLSDTLFPATEFNAAGTVFAGLQLSTLEIVPDDTRSEEGHVQRPLGDAVDAAAALVHRHGDRRQRHHGDRRPRQCREPREPDLARRGAQARAAQSGHAGRLYGQRRDRPGRHGVHAHAVEHVGERALRFRARQADRRASRRRRRAELHLRLFGAGFRRRHVVGRFHGDGERRCPADRGRGVGQRR